MTEITICMEEDGMSVLGNRRSESRTLEYKEALTKSYLKTVSAFANYDGGSVIFGVQDNGEAIGIENSEQLRLSVENQINDNIHPRPRYLLEQYEEDGKVFVELKVEAGSQPPYYYQKKAYIRNDTSTIEVSDYEFNDLILKGRNLTYDKLSSPNQELTFNKLTDTFQNETNNALSTNDLPAILGLYTSGSGYNNAGLLFSDQNHFPGIRIVKFGKDENTIWLRRDLENISMIELMENALDTYRQQYQPEKIEGAKRITKSMIPEESYREALANALVHRNWAIDSPILIKMYPDKITISSPGVLVEGVQPDTYLRGAMSKFRNPVIGWIFLRLGYIEGLSTGVMRINAPYANAYQKPEFEFLSNALVITLPVLNDTPHLTSEQNQIYQLFNINRELSLKKIQKLTGLSSSSARNNTNFLVQRHILERIGGGPKTRYRKSTMR